MPNLPIYDSQKNIKATSAGVTSERITPGMKAAEGLNESVQAGIKMFSDAQDTMQATNARASYTISAAQIKAESDADTGLIADENGNYAFQDNSEEYISRLEEARTKALDGLSNKSVSDLLSKEIGLSSQIEGVKIRSGFVAKQLDFNETQIPITLDGFQKTIVNSASSPGEVAIAKQSQEAYLRAQVLSGILSPEEADDALKETVVSSILGVSESDPAGALLLTEENSDILDAEEKKSLITDIESIAKIQTKKDNIAELKIKQETQKSFNEREKEISHADKIRELNKGIELKTMDKGWAEAKKAAILSEKGIDATTKTEYFYDIVKKINSASTDYEYNEDEESAQEYMKTLLAAEVDIEKGVRDGYLDEKDRGTLYNRIYTKEAAKSREDLPDDLKEATKYFEKELPRKHVSQAIRKYIAATDGKSEDNLNYDAAVRRIKVEYLIGEDPTFKPDDKTDINNVSIFRVDQELRNPESGEGLIMGENGQWVPIL